MGQTAFLADHPRFHRPAPAGTPLAVRRPSGLAAKPTLGLIGLGAFGAFCVPHLSRFFHILGHDPARDGAARALALGVVPATLAEAAAASIVIPAVPVAVLAEVAAAIAPHLRPGALVVDVCSLKVEPMAVLERILPASVVVVGTHPLFGPASGAKGIKDLRVAVCPGHGPAGAKAEDRVAAFLARRLGLAVHRVSAVEHDRQMAYVQGLTHLLSRIVTKLDVPEMSLATGTFDHLMRMVHTVDRDSEALFRTITEANPFVGDLKARLGAITAEVCAPRDGAELQPPALSSALAASGVSTSISTDAPSARASIATSQV
ncbi:prephenate dehydrogenase [Rhodospirillum rubrum]|uniref:prephenate dehydrogenase/arogenate dehydrogenase family protein n=1 Tax=Rhodospirillum rubrum TaxID=1085 RepID=UPI0019059AAB|nr:prephenate dehydrogenase/arogenate dehydrogenase family protein [Rhodospirillum rubrum]MBK1663953.1 prephenate dehydrogenase [Rhodospirillum rubrum]MBK1676597.1 prephenate dehydrogenase [Rhodospirillum rubrum]